MVSAWLSARSPVWRRALLLGLWRIQEQHDEWAEGRRHLGLDVLAQARVSPISTTAEEAPTTDTIRRSAPDPNRRSRINREDHTQGLDPA
jgi:hypothetical protein